MVTELGTRVDPDASVIRVDGARVTVDDTLVYLAINKPRGMHSTMSDDRAGRASATSSSIGFAATRSSFTSGGSTPTPRGC